MVAPLLYAHAAFDRYEAVRPRLPTAYHPATSHMASNLGEIADRFDGFLLDAFGVLNVGDTAVPGAVARMAELRARGKRLCVLTNGASSTHPEAVEKYLRFGFDFSADEVVTSRDVALSRLESLYPGAHWAAFGAAGDTFADTRTTISDAIEDHTAFETADAILFLSTTRWSDALQDRFIHALLKRPRPVVVANPDLIAPRENRFSQEPGLFAHDLIDRTGATVHWFGKPFGTAFGDALAHLRLPAHRVAMVGDTLHTDVLGGAAAGTGTVLVANHGLFAGQDVSDYIARSGIVPDIVCGTT